jgi:hypothetical protein
MPRIIAYDFGVPGGLNLVCPGCFRRAIERGAVWRAAPNSPWLDIYDGNPVGVYRHGEKPPGPQCDDCGRALE